MANMIDKKKMKAFAAKELKKAKAELTKAGKKVEDFVKKNPEKAAIIAAGVGAAVGAAITGLLTKKAKKKK
jgi:ABC-type sugar transport system substrate-binding protein